MVAGGSSRGGDGVSSAPLADRICDFAVAGFALWTVACHAMVAIGGSLRGLLVVFAVALAAALWTWRMARRTGAVLPVEPEAAGPSRSHSQQIRVAGLVIAGIGALAIDPVRHPVLLWWWGAATLAVAAGVFLFRTPVVWQPAARARSLELGLCAIALACAVWALCVHRPDIDDAFYVNVAVAAVDAPGAPLLAGDTLHGVANLPLHMPAHRIHSWELWNAGLALVTGIPALTVFHWLSAALIAALVPLAHARLFRLIAPGHWLWAVAALVVVLVVGGETHRSYGNFAFVRIWQGKAVFLFVFTPLVYAHALRFAREPSLSRWLLLAGAQIGAVGCSSSGLWAAPAAALAAMACTLRPRPRDLAVLAIGASASLYVLTVGLLLKGELAPLLAPAIVEFDLGAQLDSALSHVFGHEHLQTFALLAIVGAWTTCASDVGRRFAIGLPLAVLAVLLNPYLDSWVAGNLTGPSFWRVMWSVPAPILMACLLITPVTCAPARWPRALAPSLGVSSLAAFTLFVPSFATWSAANAGAADVGIRVGTPGLKVPEIPYLWAQRLTDLVPAGATVVAPPRVSAWIPTFHDRAFPLQARRLYLERHRLNGTLDDTELRAAMTRYAGGVTEWEDPDVAFGAGLERFDVGGVCLRKSSLSEQARRVLSERGYTLAKDGPRYEIWIRGGS